PSSMYAVQILTFFNPVKMSNRFKLRQFIPETRLAWRIATASNQPIRRGRPVTVPYSWAFSRIQSPVSFVNSVGNGPSPTRVEYALQTPTILVSDWGPTPAPASAPPTTGFEDVTYGYVP